MDILIILHLHFVVRSRIITEREIEATLAQNEVWRVMLEGEIRHSEVSGVRPDCFEWKWFAAAAISSGPTSRRRASWTGTGAAASIGRINHYCHRNVQLTSDDGASSQTIRTPAPHPCGRAGVTCGTACRM